MKNEPKCPDCGCEKFKVIDFNILECQNCNNVWEVKREEEEKVENRKR